MFAQALRQWWSATRRSRRYWHRRFSSDHRGWTAGGDRGLSSEVNRRSAGELLRVLEQELLQIKPHLRGTALLDAGCGMGHFTALAHRLGFDARGVDFCGVAVERARRRHAGVAFSVADLSDLRLEGGFDVILCINVLVAIVEPRAWRRTLAGLARHLNPGGVLMVLQTFRPPRGAAAAEHVCFRSVEEYAREWQRLGLAIHDHRTVALRSEQVCKELLVVGPARVSGAAD